MHASKTAISTRHANNRLRRHALALSCVLAMQSVSASSVQWPEPAPTQKANAHQAQSGRILQTQPNFKAPSATQCARAPRLMELHDPYRNASSSSSKRPSRPAHRMESIAVEALTHSDASAPASAIAAPAPSSAPVITTTPSEVSASGSGSAHKESVTADIGHSVLERSRQAPAAIVTVGAVDDNADFGEYRAFLARTSVAHRPRDTSARHLLQVRDTQGKPVADAEVAVQAEGHTAAMWARTDSAGKAWLHPNAFDDRNSPRYRITVKHGGVENSNFLQREQKNAVEIHLPTNVQRGERAQLDLLFMVDATGSMADEIEKLQSSLQAIVREVSALPARPDICLGLVSYRDRGDAFFVRGWDFTNDVAAFQSVLNELRAGGGGDYPEAMSEALNMAVQEFSWRGASTSRMLITVADAPPHLDYEGPRYDEDMLAALGKGIKWFGVGASGLDKQGEFIMRQLAQYTGGRFIFLTYADAARPESGAGTNTQHDVSNYSVQTLDRLIVRLITDELTALSSLSQ